MQCERQRERFIEAKIYLFESVYEHDVNDIFFQSRV